MPDLKYAGQAGTIHIEINFDAEGSPTINNKIIGLPEVLIFGLAAMGVKDQRWKNVIEAAKLAVNDSAFVKSANELLK
jgi:hypothetical protein